jgi:hypothetical protein
MPTKLSPGRLDSTKDFSSLVPSAFQAANAAYAQSNSSTILISAAFDKANTAANSASGVESYANAAFLQANIATTDAATADGNAATADDKAVTAGSYANSAYTHANAAFITANSGGGGGVTTFSAGITGFLPSTNTSGAIVLSGTLGVASGGTGVTTSTGSGDVVLGTNPTISGPTINNGYTEQVFAVSGATPALDDANGSIQTWTLPSNSTPTSSLTTGQSITLMITAGAFTITWPSVTWKTGSGTAPTLNTSGVTAVQLWNVGGVLYGARVGNN